MDIESAYQEIISQLRDGKRPRVKRSQEEFQELSANLLKLVNEDSINQTELQKILCILDHTQNKSSLFDEVLPECLRKITEKDSLIYLLSVSQTHLVERLALEGNPLPASYIESLKNLLKSADLEVLEWALRTIEGIGRQSFRLHKEVLEIKPGPLTFNKNKKNIREIIQLLEKQWGPFLKNRP
jgi:type I site-specific restriction-modification system R (restriction) subunit